MRVNFDNPQISRHLNCNSKLPKPEVYLFGISIIYILHDLCSSSCSSLFPIKILSCKKGTREFAAVLWGIGELVQAKEDSIQAWVGLWDCRVLVLFSHSSVIPNFGQNRWTEILSLPLFPFWEKTCLQGQIHWYNWSREQVCCISDQLKQENEV